MIAIIIDDDINSRRSLQVALSECEIITNIQEFSTCYTAMQWVEDHRPDVVLMECVVENVSTLKMASDIQKKHPNCKIVFCTKFPYFALDAFQIHASGYLLKPILPKVLQEELNYIFGYTNTYTIHAQCFGWFEVRGKNKLLDFKRNKTKELLALLIDHNGEGLSAKQICTYLWGDDDQKHINYLYQLFDDLRQTLKQVNADQVFVKNGTKYAINPSLIDCDYYSYLKLGKPVFCGEYMTQYSWAEKTCSVLKQNA